MQYALFPMDVINISRRHFVESHTGIYAWDIGGKDGGKDDWKAPCDVRVIGISRYAGPNTYANTVYFGSLQ